jgi:hypothetical protein
VLLVVALSVAVPVLSVAALSVAALSVAALSVAVLFALCNRQPVLLS